MQYLSKVSLSPTLKKGNTRRAITATAEMLSKQKTGVARARSKGVIFQRLNTDKCKAKSVALIGIVDVYKTKLEGEEKERR